MATIEASIIRLLPTGVSIDDAATAMAGLAAFLMVIAVYQTLRPANSTERRIAALNQRRQELRDTQMNALNRRNHARQSLQQRMQHILHQLNLLRSREADEARRLLARAGFMSRDATVAFLFARLCLPFVFGTVAALNIFVLHIIPVAPTARIAVLACAIIGGLFAPVIYVKNVAGKRREMIQKALPDGLDLLIICVEAGLTLDAALTRVAHELSRTWRALSEEFALTSVELTFLPERRQAFHNLNQRTDLPALRGVISTLQQAEKFGTPLANSLRVLATEFRDNRMIRAEEKAARLPSLLTVPMMVFILPVLFIVLLGPAILNALGTMGHS